VPLDQNKTHTHVNDTNPSATTPSLEPLAILYQADHPADPALWDGNFSSISLFGTVEVLRGDAKNIACSLQRIATFIKQRPLGERNSSDIPQISNFGFAAWGLISAIYNSGWDKLLADDNSRTFQQYVVPQFNRSVPTISKTSNKSVTKK